MVGNPHRPYVSSQFDFMDFGINSWEHAVGYFRPACFMDFGESCTLNCTAMGQAALGMVWRKARPPYARQCHKPGPVGNALPRARPPLAMPSQGHGRRWQAIPAPGRHWEGLAAGRPPLGNAMPNARSHLALSRPCSGRGRFGNAVRRARAVLFHGALCPRQNFATATMHLARPCHGPGHPWRAGVLSEAPGCPWEGLSTSPGAVQGGGALGKALLGRPCQRPGRPCPHCLHGFPRKLARIPGQTSKTRFVLWASAEAHRKPWPNMSSQLAVKTFAANPLKILSNISFKSRSRASQEHRAEHLQPDCLQGHRQAKRPKHLQPDSLHGLVQNIARKSGRPSSPKLSSGTSTTIPGKHDRTCPARLY